MFIGVKKTDLEGMRSILIDEFAKEIRIQHGERLVNGC
jgi:hypothetical protein